VNNIKTEQFEGCIQTLMKSVRVQKDTKQLQLSRVFKISLSKLAEEFVRMLSSIVFKNMKNQKYKQRTMTQERFEEVFATFLLREPKKTESEFINGVKSKLAEIAVERKKLAQKRKEDQELQKTEQSKVVE